MEKIRSGEVESTVEEKLRALYNLQLTDSAIDAIKILRGELPLEVQDLEDEVEGLETRIVNLREELKELEQSVGKKSIEIADAEALIKKYTDQQNNVRNNREFDSLSKEIEYQNLEIELCNKKIKEFSFLVDEKKLALAESEAALVEKRKDFESKQGELSAIVADTQKDEETMAKKSEEYRLMVEERLLTAYHRIRENARNGLAVVTIQRDACGGCFNQIPPQRQLDIRTSKKIIVCEYCGRILVDEDITKEKE